jgi:hypothetical protein
MIEMTAAERGGRCLSTYVDKETGLEWQRAEGHTWSAPWFRVSKGQWCLLDLLHSLPPLDPTIDFAFKSAA